MTTAIEVAVALQAMKTAYALVKKYEQKKPKRSRRKHTAVTTNKNGRKNY